MSISPMLGRAALKHCPLCGQGHLFRHWVTMVDECPGCGLHFRRIDGQWLGSWFLNITVAQAAVALVLVVGVAIGFPNPDMAVIAGVGLVVACAVPVGFFPFSRTLWTAIDLAMRPVEFDEGVAPGFELEQLERQAHPSGPRRR